MNNLRLMLPDAVASHCSYLVDSGAPSGVIKAGWDLEELAAAIRVGGTASPGVKFARLPLSRRSKEIGRALALKPFTRRAWGRDRCLSILTMPGLRWPFESRLLNQREPPGRLCRAVRPRRTYICGIERDESVFRASLGNIPRHADAHIAHLAAAPFATATIRTDKITRYHRCRFSDFVRMSDFPQDAAWLDFNGWLSDRRWRSVASLWKRLSRVLILTFQVHGSAVTAGGEDPALWVWKELGKPRVLHIHRYCGMVQIGVEKPP